VLTRGLAAQVNHAFRRWLTATGTFAFWLDDYEGSPRVDKRYAASAHLQGDAGVLVQGRISPRVENLELPRQRLHRRRVAARGATAAMILQL
jgi:hypothetical protein